MKVGKYGIRFLLESMEIFTQAKKIRSGYTAVSHIKAYIYLCVVNKLVSDVTAAIFDSLRAEVRVRVPASVGSVCIACTRRGMLHSGCCHNSH